MLDEAIANLTCALNKNGMGDNTVMVIVSDNGGEKHIEGNSHPFRGHKVRTLVSSYLHNRLGIINCIK